MPRLIKNKIDFGRIGYDVDWDKLTDCRIYQLEPGKDFPIGTPLVSVQTSARQAAIRRGFRARTATVGDGVAVQFYK